VTISPHGDESKITVGQHGLSQTLSTLTFPVLHPTILDFSTLLEVINSHAPFYTIEEYQCYCYAGAAYDVIKLEFNAAMLSPAADWTLNISRHLSNLRGEF
jgi:hypothetical protein